MSTSKQFLTQPIFSFFMLIIAICQLNNMHLHVRKMLILTTIKSCPVMFFTDIVPSSIFLCYSGGPEYAIFRKEITTCSFTIQHNLEAKCIYLPASLKNNTKLAFNRKFKSKRQLQSELRYSIVQGFSVQ